MLSRTLLTVTIYLLATTLPVRPFLVDSKAYRNGSMGKYPVQKYETIQGEYPIFNFDKLPPDPKSDEYIFLAIRGAGVKKPGAVILDWSGGLVWDGTEFGETMASSVQTYLGNRVLALWQGEIYEGGWGRGHVLLIDQTYTVVANISTTLSDQGQGIDFHEIQITPEDTALIIVYREHKEDKLLSGVVQEINVTTGQAVFTWDSMDHIKPEECYVERQEETDDPWDYIHLNSVEKDPHGNFLISARHCNALYYISPTGSIIWKLGGKQSNFTGSTFSFQHDARWHDGRISLFDNSATPWSPPQNDLSSRGMIIDLDYDHMTVKETSFPAPLSVEGPSESQGNFQSTENDGNNGNDGNWIVGWGSEPYITEFVPNGTALWTAQFGLEGGVSSYRAVRDKWTGYPKADPDISVVLPTPSPPSRGADTKTLTGNTGSNGDEGANSGNGTPVGSINGGNDNVTVQVSWSGATEVDYYLLLAFSSPSFSSEIGKTDHLQFQDEITIKQSVLSGKESVQVVAYSFNGRALGWSDKYWLKDGRREKGDEERMVGTGVFTPQPSRTPTGSRNDNGATSRWGSAGFVWSAWVCVVIWV